MSSPAITEKKQYTFADYLSWEDDSRYELLNGTVTKMTPAPSRLHQKISVSLLRFLVNNFKSTPCEVYHAPFDVRLPTHPDEISDDKIVTVVQPDICVICDPSKLDDKGCVGAPDLIIEIVSSGSAQKDVVEKFRMYEDAGVREYWLVYPEEKTVTIFKLTETSKYDKPALLGPESTMDCSIFDTLVIPLNHVFDY
jgi:Uma2 family endonuclease